MVILLVGEIIVVSVLCFIIYVIVSLVLLHRKYEHLPGPPLDSFWFGHGPSVFKHIMSGGHYFSFILENTKKYGPVYRLINQNQAVVYVTDQKAIKELLVTGKHVKPREVYAQLGYIFGARFLGEGMLTQSDYTMKSSMRTRIQRKLQRSCIKELTNELNEAADILIAKLTQCADGKTKVRMFDEFNCISMDLIGKVGYGMEINSINNTDGHFVKAFEDVFKAIIQRGRSPMLAWNPLNWPYCWRVIHECKYLRQVCAEIIRERIAATDRGDYVPDDILKHMMQKGGDKEDIEVLVDDFITFFVAGQETSSCLMSFMIIALGQFPEVMNRLRKEIDLVVGERPFIDFKDLSRLTYLDMVMKETLRLYPPSAATYRQVTEDYFIDNYKIPNGTSVCLSMYALLHHEDYFDEPTKFMPERFDPKNEDRISVYRYFPFSMGPRMCIGRHFAEAESKIMIAKLIQRFDIHLDSTQNLGIEEVLLHRPKDGALCTFTLRDQSNNQP